MGLTRTAVLGLGSEQGRAYLRFEQLTTSHSDTARHRAMPCPACECPGGMNRKLLVMLSLTCPPSQANVVCVVYDVSEEATIEKVSKRPPSLSQVPATGTQLGHQAGLCMDPS